jgi:large subunit ribosomal protein L35Ae
MKGVIVHFRKGVTHQTNSHMVVKVEGVDKKDSAAKLVGKVVTWKNSKGTEIKGTVAAAHGNSGAVRVIFEKGMPGQSLGTKVELN